MKILIALSILSAFALAQGQSKPDLNIIDGFEADRNQFPYQVSLQQRVFTNTFKHFCGGSIISANWILTAAHCTCEFTASELSVVAGILLLNDTNMAGQQTSDVQTIINHPSFPCIGNPAPNDIALIRLATSLSWVKNVQPIAIPAAGHTSLGNGTLSGWGRLEPYGDTPNHLQFAVLPIVPEIQCKKQWDRIFPNNIFSIELNLCSGTIRGHESACKGDSGGPYVQDGKVIGVVSWVDFPCGKIGAPSVYVKTSAYTAWITNNTKGEVRP